MQHESLQVLRRQIELRVPGSQQSNECLFGRRGWHLHHWQVGALCKTDNQTQIQTDDFFQEEKTEEYDLDARAADALVLEANLISEANKAPALYTYADLVQDCSFAGAPCAE